MDSVIRFGVKLIGALVMIVGLLALCMIAAWAILDLVSPRMQLLFLVAMSAFSGILVAALTVYRLITTLRSASLTLLLTAPILISLMAGVILYWEFIMPLTKEYAPWAQWILDAIDGFMDYLDKYLGGR